MHDSPGAECRLGDDRRWPPGQCGRAGRCCRGCGSSPACATRSSTRGRRHCTVPRSCAHPCVRAGSPARSARIRRYATVNGWTTSLGAGFALITTARPGGADEAALRRRKVAVLVAEAGSPAGRHGYTEAAPPPRWFGPTGPWRAPDATSPPFVRGRTPSFRPAQITRTLAAGRRSPVSEPSAAPRC